MTERRRPNTHRLRRLSNALTAVAITTISVGILAFIVPSFRDAAFVLRNQASRPVDVTVTWADDSRVFDGLRPGERVRWTLDGESAARFHVRFADATSVDSPPVYFAAGLEIIATVHDGGVIETRYATP